MNQDSPQNQKVRDEAARLNMLLNDLSLFTRKTLLDWLPELESQTGITGERFMVMFELHLEPDRGLKELAQTLMISPSSLSVMINSMVEQGLVSRVTDPADRRRVLLRLSDNGADIFEKAEGQVVENFQTYLLNLPEKDREDLNEATSLMLKVMERILRPFTGELHK